MVTTIFRSNDDASGSDVYPVCYVFEGKTGYTITFAPFKKMNILNKTRNYTESGDKSDDESIITMYSGNGSDHELISTDMLENIPDGIQTHPNVNRREANYKIRDRIKQIQSEWKVALKATQRMGKGLHKVFKTYVKEISQEFPPLRESGS